MASIRSQNTKPELIVRKLLFKQGFRYRLHNKILPGSPDITMKKHKAAVFIQGCFWHCHGCHISHIPKNNIAFWQRKIKRNLERDKRNVHALLKAGWRVLLIWECALMTKTKLPEKELLIGIQQFLFSDATASAIKGKAL